MTAFSIPGTSGAISLEVKNGRPLFILGRNGTGKSALVQAIVGQLGGRVVYLPGSRTSSFDSEALQMNPSTRRALTNNLRMWDTSPDARWRTISGSQRNEKAVHDLTAAEFQYKLEAANKVKVEGRDSSAIAELQLANSPLDIVNGLLEQSNLAVRMIVSGAELQAMQNGQVYSFARMSDGERTALILIAETVSAPDGSTFLIDEPELHLHRAIIIPLLSALLRHRSHCEFIVSTHELELPGAVTGAAVCIVRSVAWASGGNAAAWDVDLISSADSIPEYLRADVLGSRRKILFVEGKGASLDQPLYTLLFPRVSVRWKESCRDVIRAVAGLRSAADMHRAEAFGVVDNDGMNQSQISALESQDVLPLAVFSVESLYYAPEVLRAVAERQAGTLDSNAQTVASTAEGFISNAKTLGLQALGRDNCIRHLAGRVAERRMRDNLMALMPDRGAMQAGAAGDIVVSLTSPYPAELEKLEQFVAVGDLASIIARYPVRESGVLDAIARALRFPARADYENAALARLSADSDLLSQLRGKLGILVAKLQ